MKASLRILALAGSAVLVAGAAACTVTTSNDLDAGDLFDDAGFSDAGTTDTGTTDTGTGVVDDPNCRNITTADGGLEQITFDTTSGACDTCMDENCCAPMEACFQDTSGQCQQLEECLTACGGEADAGGCSQDCGDAFDSATGDLHNAWAQCEQDSCVSSCP